MRIIAINLVLKKNLHAAKCTYLYYVLVNSDKCKFHSNQIQNTSSMPACLLMLLPTQAVFTPIDHSFYIYEYKFVFALTSYNRIF